VSVFQYVRLTDQLTNRPIEKLNDLARIFLGLGANVGNREGNLRTALRWLAPKCRVVAVSSVWRSEAVVLEGQAAGPEFRNAACEVETELSPRELLAHVKEIEHAIGRRPAPRWSARPIDIDILLYGDQIIDTEELRVPHPLIAERAFVLAPLAEIAGEVVVPGVGRRVSDLAAAVDCSGVEVVGSLEV
jgi:2-amino-4-hydroxy-6-hydroxymethyldihydropteridine diphosphokinase